MNMYFPSFPFNRVLTIVYNRVLGLLSLILVANLWKLCPLF